MLGRALKMTFWVSLDHMGKLLVASTIWGLAVGIPAVLFLTAVFTDDAALFLAVGLPSLFLGLFVVAPAVGVGLVYMAKELIERRDGTLRLMFHGIRRYGGRAAALGGLYGALTVCLLASAWFYPARLGAGGLIWLGYGLGAIAAWALIFLALTALFAAPALVQKKVGALATFRLSAVLVLANPLLALGLGIQMIALTAVALAFPPVFLFLYGGLAAAFLSSAYELLARKYAAAEGDTDVLDDADDDYLNRGFRDLLFPWKYE